MISFRLHNLLTRHDSSLSVAKIQIPTNLASTLQGMFNRNRYVKSLFFIGKS